MSQSVESDVVQVAAELVSAFGRHDQEAYFSFFAPEATFVFYTHDKVLGSTAEWQALWTEWEETAGFRVLDCTSAGGRVDVISDDVAVFTHTVTTTLLMDGEEETVQERETIVFRKFPTGWLAIHEHLSPLPEAAS